jgi:hypothetical protein
MATVTVACSIQGGLIVGTDEWNNPIKLNGPPQPTSGLDSGFGNARHAGFTTIDQTIWENWLGIYATNPIVTSGAVWQVS